jgi:hypothetical protein
MEGVCDRTLLKAEGEGFEPSIRLTTDNGFRDETTCLLEVAAVQADRVWWEGLRDRVCDRGRVEAA